MIATPITIASSRLCMSCMGLDADSRSRCVECGGRGFIPFEVTMSGIFDNKAMDVFSFLSPEQQASLIRSAEKPMGKLIGSDESRESYTVGGPLEPTITTKLDFGL